MRKEFLFRLTVFSILLSHLFARPTPVNACSCVGPSQPDEEFVHADAVFTGRVMTIVVSRVQDPSGLSGSGSWPYEVTFEVDKSWKKITGDRVTLLTGHGEGDCGYPFVEGNDYLVYAYELGPGRGTGLATNICTRTATIFSATEDLAYLNTIPNLPSLSENKYSWIDSAGTILLATIVALGLIYEFKRRQRKKSIDRLSA